MAEEPDVLDAGPPEENVEITNKNPYFIGVALNSVMSFLASYGWFIVLGAIFAMVVWSNVKDPLRKFLKRRKKNRDVTDSMTPEQIYERMESMDKARNKMQENYDRLVAQEAEKKRQMNEQKLSTKINDYDAMVAGKTRSSTTNKFQIQQKLNEESTSKGFKKKKDAKPMRPNDTSPLGGSGNYQPRYRPGGNRPRGGG